MTPARVVRVLCLYAVWLLSVCLSSLTTNYFSGLLQTTWLTFIYKNQVFRMHDP